MEDGGAAERGAVTRSAYERSGGASNRSIARQHSSLLRLTEPRSVRGLKAHKLIARAGGPGNVHQKSFPPCRGGTIPDIGCTLTGLGRISVHAYPGLQPGLSTDGLSALGKRRRLWARRSELREIPSLR